MAWRTVKGRRYYYRSRWHDGSAQSKYVGGGMAAELAAAQDKRRQQAALRHRRLVSALRSELDAVAEASLCTLIWTDLLLSASLICAGYYSHHRSWRERKRYAREP